MEINRRQCLAIFGTMFLFALHLQECIKLDGYKFLVYSASFCPKNKTEWKKRSKVLNCTEKNGYTCLPNEHFTELLEFCYTDPFILIEEGLCLYLIKSNSLFNGYKCHNFRFGCPSSSYLSTNIYDYPGCTHVENGCFFADSSCKRTITSPDRKTTKQTTVDKKYTNKTDDSTASFLQETTVYTRMQRENYATEDKTGWIVFVILLALSFLVGVLSTLFIIYKKKNQKSRKTDKTRDEIEDPLITKEQSDENQPEKKTSTNGQMIFMEQLEAPTNDQNIKSNIKRRATAVVDLGTLYSVYAYSRESNWSIIQSEKCPKKNFSSKASTSLILNSEQTVRAFGYEAGLIYFESDDDEKQKTERERNGYYFPGFTALLYYQNLDLYPDIEDFNGEKFQALSIFSVIIEYFKNSLLEAISLSSLEGTYSKSDVDFVLALPANCGEGAKDLMRKAAEKAGIEANQLTIVYEEEAISSYCKHLKKENKIENGFMVVDLGGGSVDIVVYKEAKDETLKKLYPPSGGRGGGVSFDCEYEQFLENIWDKDIIKRFAKDYMEDYLIMQSDFETKIRVPWKESVIISIPHNFHKLLKEKYAKADDIKKALDASIYKKVKYCDHKLTLPLEVIKKFFQEKVEYVVNIIKQNHQSTDVKSIIIFGGLAEINIIEHSLRERLHADFEIWIPPTARLVVSKGALWHGHNTNAN